MSGDQLLAKARELVALHKKATPGPWTASEAAGDLGWAPAGSAQVRADTPERLFCLVPFGILHASDVALICAARNLAPDLAQAVIDDAKEREHAAAYGMPDTYRKALEEVESWRTGAEGAFGIVTANPHESLCKIAFGLEEHHQEHHAREAMLEAALERIATGDHCGYDHGAGAETCYTIASDALAKLRAGP